MNACRPLTPQESVLLSQLLLIYSGGVDMDKAHEEALRNSAAYNAIHTKLPHIHVTLKLWLAAVEGGVKLADDNTGEVDLIQWIAKYKGMMPCP